MQRKINSGDKTRFVTGKYDGGNKTRVTADTKTKQGLAALLLAAEPRPASV